MTAIRQGSRVIVSERTRNGRIEIAGRVTVVFETGPNEEIEAVVVEGIEIEHVRIRRGFEIEARESEREITVPIEAVEVIEF